MAEEGVDGERLRLVGGGEVTKAEDAPNFRSAARRSMLRNNVFAVECFAVLGGYMYILLAKGALWDGLPASRTRCAVLAGMGAVYIARLLAMARWLLPREIAMEELTFVILVWVPGILASYALAAIRTSTDISTPLLAVSVGLYVLGSFMNTGSELQRKWWKAHPENKGRCYTKGMFSLSRNINYLGDVVLFSGWAVASGAWWNAWAPVVMAATFYFHHIPDKEKYLAERYAADWPEYSARVKAFIPFVC